MINVKEEMDKLYQEKVLDRYDSSSITVEDAKKIFYAAGHSGFSASMVRSIVLNCTNLITVDFSGLDFSNIVTDNWNPLNGAVNVENLRWGKNYSVSMSFSQNTKLTVDSLMSIINNLPDLTGSTAQTLTLGSTNLAKLSSSQVAIATNKNWNVV